MKQGVSTVTAAAFMSACVLAGEPAFPTWHGATTLSGTVKEQVPDFPVQLWKFMARGSVSYAPVVGDGRVFVVAGSSHIIALDMAGTQAWDTTLSTKPADTNTPVEKIAVSAPPAYAFGTLVLATSDGVIYALDGKNGNEKWKAGAGAAVQASPNFVDMGSNGFLVVLLLQAEGVLVAFDGASGKEKWRTSPYGRIDGHFAVSEKRIAFGGCDAAIHVVSAETGDELASVSLGEGSEVAGGVAFVGKMVYSGSRSGALHAIDTEKKNIKWSFGGGAGELFSTPAANGDVVVFSAGSGAVTSVGASDSKERWSFDPGGMGAQSPIIAGERVVSVVDGKIHILDLKDGKKPIWSSASIGDVATPPAVANGTVIVGSDSGLVVAFGAKQPKTGETK